MSRNQHVVCTDRNSSGFQLRAQFGIAPVTGGLNGNDRNPIKQLTDFLEKTRREPPYHAEAQFGGDNDANESLLLADSGQASRNPAMRIADEIGHDICVQE